MSSVNKDTISNVSELSAFIKSEYGEQCVVKESIDPRTFTNQIKVVIPTISSDITLFYGTDIFSDDTLCSKRFIRECVNSEIASKTLKNKYLDFDIGKYTNSDYCGNNSTNIDDYQEMNGVPRHKLAFVCSRYRGDGTSTVEANVESAKYYCKRLTDRGWVAFAPHLYFTQFLKDEILDERKTGINLGKDMIRRCDAVFVFLKNRKASEGMKCEIEFAKKLGKKIFYIDSEVMCQTSGESL